MGDSEVQQFFKLVCINENDPFEYKVNADVNRATLDEVHEYVKNNFDKFIGSKWILLPCSVTVTM